MLKIRISVMELGRFTLRGRSGEISLIILLGRGERNDAGTRKCEGVKAVGDFNGDGMDDVVVVDGSAFVRIFCSRGDGTFYEAAILNAGEGTGAFATGDFNGDGLLDVAVGLYPSTSVAMFFQQPDGTFTLSYICTGVGSFAMRVADLNGDGKLDMVEETYPPELPPTSVNVIFHK